MHFCHLQNVLINKNTTPGLLSLNTIEACFIFKDPKIVGANESGVISTKNMYIYMYAYT